MNIKMSKVSYEEKNGLGYILIDDPPANKTSIEFLDEFGVIVREYVTQSNVKGIIITGNGRHFSSGADVDKLKEIYSNQTIIDNNGNVVSYPSRYLRDRSSLHYFTNLNKPVISAINGMCIGSGFEIATSSHIRICGKGSIVGLPESTFGFFPGLSGTLRYTECIGLGKALELVLSGETLFAQQAFEIGLVHGIVEKKDLLKYCEDLINYILERPSIYSKKYIQNYIDEFNQLNK